MSAPYRLSRWGMTVGVGLALVVWPGLAGLALWKVGIFAPDPPFWAWIILAFVVLVVPALGIAPARELRSAWRTRITDEAIEQGGVRIGWGEITAVQREVGMATISAGDRQIRLATYLFEDREGLERALDQRARAAGAEPEIRA